MGNWIIWGYQNLLKGPSPSFDKGLRYAFNKLFLSLKASIFDIITVMTESLLKDVSIESGVLSVGDPTLQPSDGVDPNNWLTHTKDGNAVCCHTGGDGTFGVIIRTTLESFNLLPDEGQLISSLSAPLFLNVTSGAVVVADMAILHEEAQKPQPFLFKVEPGVYQCMIHMCENQESGFFGFIILLKKTDNVIAKNDNLREIEQLG